MPEQRYYPGDVAVGDYVWGAPAHLPHPVIRINRDTVTVGIHRDGGDWFVTERIAWGDIRGMFPADNVPTRQRDEFGIGQAVQRIRAGYLSCPQRDSLAALLLLVAHSTACPTPLVAAAFNAITALNGGEHR